MDYGTQETVHESTGILSSAVANIKNWTFYLNGIALALHTVDSETTVINLTVATEAHGP